MIINAKNP